MSGFVRHFMRHLRDLLPLALVVAGLIGGPAYAQDLSAAERDRLLVKVSALTSDPNVRLAVESQIRLGSYHLGTDKIIQQALEAQGLMGEEMKLALIH